MFTPRRLSRESRTAPPKYQIQIVPPNGQPRPLVYKQSGVLTVGSGAHNDLVLHDAKVKPEHLRLEFFGNSIQVTHLHTLEASNGRSANVNAQPKQEFLRPNSTLHIGDHQLVLHEVRVAERGQQYAELRIARALLGPGIDFTRMGCIGTPLTQIMRMRGLLTIIFTVGLLLGVLTRWVDRIVTPWTRPTPTATALPGGIGGATPITVTPSVVVTTPVAVALPAPTLTFTPIPPTATPTRIPLIAFPPVVAVGNLGGAAVGLGGLVDGPLPPTPVPPPPELAAESAQAGAVPSEDTAPVAGPNEPTTVIALDPVLRQLGVWAEPASVPVGSDYWRLASARWLDATESQGRNHILLEVVDKSGQRAVGEPLTITWGEGSVSSETDRPNPEIFAFAFPMSEAGNVYSVRMDSYPSESIHGLGLGTPAEPLSPSQPSFYLTFELVTRQ